MSDKTLDAGENNLPNIKIDQKTNTIKNPSHLLDTYLLYTYDSKLLI